MRQQVQYPSSVAPILTPSGLPETHPTISTATVTAEEQVQYQIQARPPVFAAAAPAITSERFPELVRPGQPPLFVNLPQLGFTETVAAAVVEPLMQHPIPVELLPFIRPEDLGFTPSKPFEPVVGLDWYVQEPAPMPAPIRPDMGEVAFTKAAPFKAITPLEWLTEHARLVRDPDRIISPDLAHVRDFVRFNLDWAVEHARQIRLERLVRVAEAQSVRGPVRFNMDWFVEHLQHRIVPSGVFAESPFVRVTPAAVFADVSWLMQHPYPEQATRLTPFDPTVGFLPLPRAIVDVAASLPVAVVTIEELLQYQVHARPTFPVPAAPEVVTLDKWLVEHARLPLEPTRIVMEGKWLTGAFSAPVADVFGWDIQHPPPRFFLPTLVPLDLTVGFLPIPEIVTLDKWLQEVWLPFLDLPRVVPVDPTVGFFPIAAPLPSFDWAVEAPRAIDVPRVITPELAHTIRPLAVFVSMEWLVELMQLPAEERGVLFIEAIRDTVTPPGPTIFPQAWAVEHINPDRLRPEFLVWYQDVSWYPETPVSPPKVGVYIPMFRPRRRG